MVVEEYSMIKWKPKNFINPKLEEFNQKTYGTIITILNFIESVITPLLFILGMFLPIFKVEIGSLSKEFSIFGYASLGNESFDNGILWGFAMNIILMIVPLFLNFISYNAILNLVNEKGDKKRNIMAIVFFAVIAVVLSIILVVLNITVLRVSSSLDMSDKFISAGIGTILAYVSAIVSSIILFINSLLMVGVLCCNLQLTKFFSKPNNM